MQYPSFYEFLFFCTGSVTLMMLIYDKLKDVTVTETIFIKCIGSVGTKEKRTSTIAIYSIRIFAGCWLISSILTISYQIFNIYCKSLESYYTYVNILLWTCFAIAGICGSLSIIAWSKYYEYPSFRNKKSRHKTKS